MIGEGLWSRFGSKEDGAEGLNSGLVGNEEVDGNNTVARVQMDDEPVSNEDVGTE